MKDHVKVEEEVYIDGLSVGEVINKLRDYRIKLLDAKFEVDYDGEVKIIGWRPMTPAEKEIAERRRKASRDAVDKRKQKQFEKDRRELERLADKLGVQLSSTTSNRKEVKT